MIWLALLWVAVGITSMAWWAIRDSDQLTRMDVLLIIWYGAVAGILIPPLIWFANGSAGEWMDRPVWRRRV